MIAEQRAIRFDDGPILAAEEALQRIHLAEADQLWVVAAVLNRPILLAEMSNEGAKDTLW